MYLFTRYRNWCVLVRLYVFKVYRTHFVHVWSMWWFVGTGTLGCPSRGVWREWTARSLTVTSQTKIEVRNDTQQIVAKTWCTLLWVCCESCPMSIFVDVYLWLLHLCVHIYLCNDDLVDVEMKTHVRYYTHVQEPPCLTIPLPKCWASVVLRAAATRIKLWKRSVLMASREWAEPSLANRLSIGDLAG